MVFTSGSEFYNTAEFITPTDSTWKRSTSYGSRKIRPVMIDGSVLFVDVVGKTVRSSVFEYTENAYIAPSISVLSDHLLTDVVSMDAVKGTNIDISDFLFVVNGDGTIAVMNSLKHENTHGWSQWTTQGEFIDVCSVNKIVYFIVKRGQNYYVEFMNEGTVLDHNTAKISDIPFTNLDTGEEPEIAAMTHTLLLDDSVMDDTEGGVVFFPRPAKKAEVGLDVEMIVRPMPINANTGDGASRNKKKRVSKLSLNLIDTIGVWVHDLYAPDRHFPVVLDEAPEKFTGIKEIRLLGWDREVSVEISQKKPLPFKMIGLGATIETGGA